MKLASGLFSLLSLILVSSVSFATDTFTVVDEANHPVANATILLGYEAGNPFPGNSFSTDASGTAAVPASWKAALPVTVQAPGFITTTIPVAMPGMMTIQLTKQEAPGQIEIKGSTSGYGRLIDDGNVHFGLLIPALNKAQMLAFDLSTVISPQIDTISVLGQDIDIPSNISLPDQTVTYIFPAHFNKPEYRSYVRSPGQYVMSATHGRFPLAKVVNDIRAGKSMFEMVNYFTFLEGGQKTVDVAGNVVGQDIAVNATPFGAQVSVQAPTFASNQVMVSLAMTEQNGLMVPTDLKRLNPGQTMALKSTGVAPSVLSLLLVNASAVLADAGAELMNLLTPINVAKPFMQIATAKPTGKQSFQQLSFSLNAASPGVAPQFLSLIDPPTLDTSNVLKMQVPATVPAGLAPVATYMVLTEIETFGTGNVQSEQRTRLWEVWSTAWLSQVELPKITFNKNPNRKYRWEVMFLAQPATSVKPGSSATTRVDLKTITHVTRNTLEL